MGKNAMIAKRGRLVVKTKDGLKPATRKELDGANLVGDRGSIYVETDNGIEPATIGDARSAVGRIARQLVKNPVAAFSDPALASRAGRKARASESMTPEQLSARAQRGWATRRDRQSPKSK